ncbi:unnamed protein product [Toxocara canis]|uniref:Agmatinase n=1 Tax=Toxocara canis TaxID=6265 RepID=A0A183UK08_TOXCA|nr:unnamed protein product [Toxocara canis]
MKTAVIIGLPHAASEQETNITDHDLVKEVITASGSQQLIDSFNTRNFIVKRHPDYLPGPAFGNYFFQSLLSWGVLCVPVID